MVGIIPPKERKLIVIHPPMESSEQAVIIARPVGSLFTQEATDTRLVIENSSEAPVTYFVAVMPRSIVSIGKLPWKKIIAEVKASSRRGTLGNDLRQTLSGWYSRHIGGSDGEKG